MSGRRKGVLARHGTKQWDGDVEEYKRMLQAKSRTKNWGRWGPYLSERQWGTVREDYSADGSAWDYFPHEHARQRAYRWGEDGLLGITDRECRVCFGLALWNGKDSILKERLFGLTGSEGNHGEDVKELYYYLDATPTSSYLKGLYKYPNAEYPYADLVEENRRRGLHDPEYELEDTGCIDNDNYTDVQAEYCKYAPNDILIRITVTNRSAEAHTLHVLPQVWLRNTWAWGSPDEAGTKKGSVRRTDPKQPVVDIDQETIGTFQLFFEKSADVEGPELWFTENETNFERVFGGSNASPYTKDSFHRKLVEGEDEAVNPEEVGTKACGHYRVHLEAGGSAVLRLRLKSTKDEDTSAVGPNDDGTFPSSFDQLFTQRIAEADAFYEKRLHGITEEHNQIQRQAFAGLLWSKQFYHYVVKTWLEGDPKQPEPHPSRRTGRNSDWSHLFNREIISMPDKWEYPWYATWDLAFHMVPMAVVDPFFAKKQLTVFLREWYMHPNGALPAYEWAFDDVNPPVHAWACWRVYKLTAPRGKRDLDFLERCFHKLMLNFTWWVNRKDPQGHHVFAGGFLGLDNIGLFDRSKPLDNGGTLVQADGTSWMAFFSLTMLGIALELAEHKNAVYEDIASKFFEHFVQISHAINTFDGTGLWNEEDGFYYDHLRFQNGETQVLKVRSMVGLIPLYACLTLEQRTLDKLPNFTKRLHWFMENTPELAGQVLVVKGCDPKHPGQTRHLLSIPTEDRLRHLLRRLFDEDEFLSPYGIRSLSKVYEKPYVTTVGAEEVSVEYTPAESTTSMFGGNSNWRGPIWFPVNYLIIEALDRYHYFHGDNLKVEVPTGSGNLMNLREAANEIARRLAHLFERTSGGKRPCNGPSPVYGEKDKDLMLFYEYFHPETGRGVGASHQTGWTALIARCLSRLSKEERLALD
ncbi:hypothetical protein PTSG_07748 [Salpingoeca rosetta]|uniref:Mannosylglycerate hydrolase MGH1-like glycoside hydrolase domain-containing protein n=1 Tax=Salpingoeca rosetta (strain ATCC 50818 / BSB-021) TaxID=946362 RepID=F2UHN7_SALR5|nr:uncharacterized protein PTSG_07748 [Salpingoeca rosetta]EGD76636.1 hypothetical protein PTSG_07748 [Salpingoeca rosetta]|eukprot:XP_004991550.1 hypothetical protein PTSG_07748 [Salpingoeca rosetta]